MSCYNQLVYEIVIKIIAHNYEVSELIILANMSLHQDGD